MAKTRYYIVQVDYEYMEDSYCNYTLQKQWAARLRLKDGQAMLDAMERQRVSGRLVPTSHKPATALFLRPKDWESYRQGKESRPW